MMLMLRPTCVFALLSGVLLLAASVEAKTAKEMCSAATCLRGGDVKNVISLDQALLMAPCVSATPSGDIACFGYANNIPGKCPFDTSTDCNTLTSAPTPAPTQSTAAPTTTVSQVATGAPSSTSANSEGGSSGGSSNTYIYIACGAAGVIAIGALVVMLVRKSARRNQDDDEIDAVEYAKPIPTLPAEDHLNKSFGGDASRPHLNKSFVQGHDPRRQNTGSFLTAQDGGVARAALVKTFNENQHPPIARPNTASFLNAAPAPHPMPHVVPNLPHAHEVKEQFYVPEAEKDFPDHNHNRRESFEF
ncbi:Aste57867_18876 [Aphanomyces stellatus]|uniref:Aste57867_18876 protein n=1 Tax=Aphanomyces stellatus TaxID=120398 RepID=A0A485LD61_9STRA|nr:hypothetical protein As57867_018812 [Aphanomyces stellatus]VFT95610.1 Aste57867_18876 [Aphanomyces stellatus]